MFLCTAITLLLHSCIIEELDKSLPESDRINKFIIEGVQTYYLWEAETDWKPYNKQDAYEAYPDHYQLFDQLLYRDDYWSTLTDDIRNLEDQFAGISTTFGYMLSFYYHPFSNDNNEVIAVVLYTSSGSPAEKAGLNRGDIIVEMNGSKLTTMNYRDLYYASSIQVRCGQVVVNEDSEGGTMVTLPEIYHLTSIEMYENPVNTYKIIELEGIKIGYLCYTGYQRESENELFQLFTQFKTAGVKDVVLDLRYNPGGYSSTAQILSSILAPESDVLGKSIYLEHHYNKLYTEYLEQHDHALYETFIDTLPVRMNLDHLYVLTSKNTASASEATIVGLRPYLELIQIGDTTSGKYCGGVLLEPVDLYGEKNKSYFEDFSNWGMYIMIYRYANKTGISSFTSGLVPDILEKELPLSLKPFGDIEDPLFARALELITGKTYTAPRSAQKAVPLTPLSAQKRPVDGLMIATPPIIAK